MNWTPSIPTDNLYKFMAVTGLWLLIGVLMLLGWLIKLDVDIQRHSKEAQAYFSSVSMLHSIKLREGSIAAGRLEENRLPGLYRYENIKDEERFLAKAAEAQEAAVSKHAYVLDEHPGYQLILLDRWDVKAFVIAYIVLAAFLFYFGFKGWKVNLHDVEVRRRTLDLEIKEKTLERLKLDISEARRRVVRRRISKRGRR